MSREMVKRKRSEVKRELEEKGLSFRNNQGEKHTNKTNKRGPLCRSIPSSWSEKGRMIKKRRGRHNKEDQFDPEKAEKGTIVHTSISEKESQTRRGSTTARPGKERNVYKEILVTGGLGRKRQLYKSHIKTIFDPSSFADLTLLAHGDTLRDILPRGDVAREFGIAHSVVSRLWKSFKTTGMSSRRHGGGRVRSRTPTKDRYIVLSAKRNRRTTAQQHCTAHLQWCREHNNWTEQDWACVLFSDECRFSLSSDCRRQLIWRESGTAYRPENIQEKDRYPTCNIMVWGGIMINGRSRLHVVANGIMTGQRYIDEVLLPHFRLFRGAAGDKLAFMKDNEQSLFRIVYTERQVAGRNYPPTNKNTLIRALTKEWDKLPQQLLDNVVLSMVRRVECCITLHGGHIPY
ncbi:transposable element Tcb2 transposase [Trichonephila clavipes]|uniref:Transposable element Tcb2 transposase n=1 Tax=Trichonephila clavipes TaxID=2585209 RepID=A0A8X6VU33_TRICX|nr:transposable element Tcb2 transposase [Trichonephila clavipes]